MSQVIRRHEIRKRQKRQQTLRRLRAKLAKATSSSQKEAVLAKLRKVAPWIPDREWLAGPGASQTPPTRRAA